MVTLGWIPGSESELPEESPHGDSYSGVDVGDLDMEAGMELKRRKWGRRFCWRGTFYSCSKDNRHSYSYILVSGIEGDSVDLAAEAELKSEWEGAGKGRASTSCLDLRCLLVGITFGLWWVCLRE